MTEWENILSEVIKLKEKHNVLWFRGHSNSSYKLNSGLARINETKTVVRNYENSIYNSFINYGDYYCDKFIEYKEWNTLFLMQHYGLHTRLLDWTDSFMTALYFANYGRNKDEAACIWVIDPIELNKNCIGIYDKTEDEGYDFIKLLTIDSLPKRIENYKNYFEKDIHINTFALVPRRNNERLVSQNGFFTIQGSELIPMEEEYKHLIDKCIYKIELPPESYIESKHFLKMNGMNYYALYGGVDGLCKYIKDELLEIKLENI